MVTTPDAPLPSQTTSGFAILDMRAEHVPAAVRIHQQALAPSFFSELGRRFLEAYYDTYRTSPYAAALVVVRDDRVVGHLVGVVLPRPHAAWLIRAHGPRLALLAVAALAVRPRLLVHFLRTRSGRYARGLLHRLRSDPAGAASTTGDAAVLAHVAVDPLARGAGVGRQLTEAFARAAAARGIDAVELVTRGEDGAGDFYRRLGYQRIGSMRDADGVRWDQYRLTPA